MFQGLFLTRVGTKQIIYQIDFFLNHLYPDSLSVKLIIMYLEHIQLEFMWGSLVLYLKYGKYSGLGKTFWVSIFWKVVFLEVVILVMKKIPLVTTQR